MTAGAWCVLLSALTASPRPAHAAPKNKPHAAVTRNPPPKNLKKRAPPLTAPADVDRTEDAANAEPASPRARERNASNIAGAARANDANPSAAATVQEDQAGVKTYRFGTVEIEGRMTSPQIIYFLRRVRAEFDAGLLGHRSFLRELSDTRNNPALR